METAYHIILVILCIIALVGLFLLWKWGREEYIDYKRSKAAEQKMQEPIDRIPFDIKI